VEFSLQDRECEVQFTVWKMWGLVYGVEIVGLVYGLENVGFSLRGGECGV
jgi:hypothetical protein